MMDAIDESYVKEILDNVASVFNLSEWRHSMEKFESIGQNYFGVLMPVRLIGKIDGKAADIPVVLKLAPTDERYRVSGAVTLMFAREIFMYTIVLKQYTTQQAALQCRLVIPQCYYQRAQYCREAIVLKDMTAEGYAPYTHTMFLDLNHMTVSLQSLARFHAHSFILKETNPKLYEEAEKTCVPLTKKSNGRYLEVLQDRISKSLNIFRNHTPYDTVLKTLKENLVKSVEATFDSVEITCICHGDMWKENILFKYDDEVPVSACLIDYQTARMSSPAFDVLYLITSSTNVALRSEHFQNLLQVYCDQIEKLLKEAGFGSQELYKREYLDKDLRTVAPACFLVANCALWLANGLQQEGHVRSKIILSTEEEQQQAVDSFRIIIKNIMDDYFTYGYLL